MRGKMFSAKASQTPNPTFTVQTYGNVKKNISTNKGDNTIPVVDMTNGTPSLGQNVSLQHYKLTTNGKFDKKQLFQKYMRPNPISIIQHQIFRILIFLSITEIIN